MCVCARERVNNKENENEIDFIDQGSGAGFWALYEC